MLYKAPEVALLSNFLREKVEKRCKIRLINLKKIIQEKTEAINFLTGNGLLHTDRCCIKCGSEMEFHSTGKKIQWRCNKKKCRHQYPTEKWKLLFMPLLSDSKITLYFTVRQMSAQLLHVAKKSYRFLLLK